jgi:phosphatidate cytidylyltransferase
MKTILVITAIYFTIGAVLVFYLWLKGKNGWLKYFSYLAIVLLMQNAYFFGWAYWANGLIVVLAFWEIFTLVHRCHVPKSYTLIMCLIFAGLTVLLFLLSKSAEHMLKVYCIVFAFDGFSQLGGQLFGRHALIKQLSPNKTTEGLVVGLLAASITSYMVQLNSTSSLSLGYGAFIGLFSLGGDLAASWFKRKAQVKDYNDLIPGHGGILDRFDSLFGASLSVLFL